jgi:hypothetical protein
MQKYECNKIFLFKQMNVVGTDTVKLSAKRIEVNVTIALLVHDFVLFVLQVKIGRKSERTKKILMRFYYSCRLFFVRAHAVSLNVKLVCVKK